MMIHFAYLQLDYLQVNLLEGTLIVGALLIVLWVLYIFNVTRSGRLNQSANQNDHIEHREKEYVGNATEIIPLTEVEIEMTNDKEREKGQKENPEQEKKGPEDNINRRNLQRNIILAERFDDIVTSRQLFLQSNLHVNDIARLLNTNRTYISLLMSEVYQCSFTHYINGKRIEFAKTLLCNNPELTLDQLSEQSGFAHVTSFCRTFKEHTGTTVRNWVSQN